MKTFLLVIGVFMMGMVPTNADTITVKGEVYTDVLIYESREFYYIKLPRKGKTMSVRKSQVNADQVEINEDAFYREQKRNLYDYIKSGGQGDLEGAKPIDSAFTDAPTAAKEIDTAALLSGGGGKALKISVDQAKAVFKNAGINLAPSPGGFKGKSADGVLAVNLVATDGKLTGISGTINATNQAQIMGKIGPVMQMATKVAPWFGGWMASSQAQLLSTGSIQKTQGGVAISLNATESGLSFSINGA